MNVVFLDLPCLAYVNNYSFRDSRTDWVTDASMSGTLVVGPKYITTGEGVNNTDT